MNVTKAGHDGKINMYPVVTSIYCETIKLPIKLKMLQIMKVCGLTV